MDIELIRTFLNVVEYQSISAAAKRLFTTQGTVSKRLQQLEQELGAPLLVRHKGFRNIELTGYGNAFILLAKQWDALYRDCQNIKNNPSRIHLAVGANQLIHLFTFSSFYQNYVMTHPWICLFTDTLHSSELYPLVDHHRIDIGYAFISRNYPHIIQIPLYQESMYLICHQTSLYENDLPLSALDPAKEIYFRWDTDFETWHEQHWPDARYLMRSTASSISASFFSTPGLWAIVPYSMAHNMAQNFPLSIYRLAETPPKRTCYQLEHRYPSPSRVPALDDWKNELKSYLNKNSQLLGLELCESLL